MVLWYKTFGIFNILLANFNKKPQKELNSFHIPWRSDCKHFRLSKKQLAKWVKCLLKNFCVTFFILVNLFKNKNKINLYNFFYKTLTVTSNFYKKLSQESESNWKFKSSELTKKNEIFQTNKNFSFIPLQWEKLLYSLSNRQV